ncbi:MAG: ABC transporter substrate-binding protein [Treponema sp.]|jgi:peptide/nickel transport system substrate-binding protein|nr:ABC transporter substrate-binding protein [Treponema sp.]
MKQQGFSMNKNGKKNISSILARVFVVMLVLIALLLTVSCRRENNAAGAKGATKGNELRYGFATEPATLDPLNPSNTADGRSILFNVFEGLVKPDAEGRLLPCAAESWTVEQGGLIYNFKLREGVRFHDGSLLNSDDVKFTLDTAVAAGFAGFTQIEKVETNGTHALSVTLLAPDPEFLPYITIGIVKANSTNREKNAVGTGPFFIENYTVQQSLTLKKFKDYWQPDLPHLDTVTIVFMADSNALILGLQGGSIDGASLTGALAQQLDSGRFDIVPGRSASAQLLALNNAAGPLGDIRVRQAISYAVDVQEIIDTAFYGRGEPSGSPLIPGIAEYYEKSLAKPYPADPARARRLLADAGYGEGRVSLSLEITVPSNYTMHVDTAQVIAVQLARIGINTQIKLVDWNTWLSDVYRARGYQATIISLDGQNVSPRSFLSRYHSGAGSNFINFNSVNYDRVYDAALVETDGEKRIALYKEAQRIISAEAASVYIQDILQYTAFPAGTFGGVVNYPLYVIDFASMYRKVN